MKSYFLDPFLVTLPSEHSSAAQIEAWFSVLEAWLDELESALYPWFHSSECLLRLQQENKFPSFQQLRQLVNRHRIDRNVALISKRLSAFIQGGSCVTSMLKTKAAVYENCQIEPMQIVERAPVTRSSLEHDFICVACDEVLGCGFSRGLVYVTAPIEENAATLRVNGMVLESDAPGEIAVVSSQGVVKVFSVVYSPRDLLQSMDCADLLALGEPGFTAGVRAELQRSFPGQRYLAFDLGREFWRSVRESAIDTNLAAFGKAVRVAAAVIADKAQEINSSDLRPLRTSATADARQVERRSDQAKAWRITITSKGVGWRLQYWFVPPKSTGELPRIEFANILKKQDPEIIPE